MFKKLMDGMRIKRIKKWEAERRLDKLLECKDLSENVRRQAETSLMEAIKASGKRVWDIGKLADLLERKDLSAPVRAQIETSLVEGIRLCGAKGWLHPDFAYLSRRKGLSDAVMIEAIRVCRVESGHYSLLKRDDLSDAVMIEAIKASGKKDYILEIGDLLEREDLSENVRAQAETSLIEAIKLHGEIGSITNIAKLLDHRNLGAPVRAQIETSLLEGIKETDHYQIAYLLEREGLSNAVMIEAIKACGKSGDDWVIAKLLERGGLSAPVRAQIEISSIDATIETIRIQGKEHEFKAIADLLERNDLNPLIRNQANDSLLEAIKFYEVPASGIDEIAELVKGVKVVLTSHTVGGTVVEDVFTTYSEGRYVQESKYCEEEVVDSWEFRIHHSCENWSMAVIEELNTVIPVKDWHRDQRANLLKRTDLSPQIRQAAEEALHPAA